MTSPGPGTEFRRGPQVSFTVEAILEFDAFVRQWSDAVPTLYFVDICVANAVKLSQDKLARDARKTSLIDRLRRLDKPQNSFSFLLALVEKVHDPRSRLSDAELREQIVGDVAALNAFFVHARVIEPDEFLILYAEALRGVPHELSQPAYAQFLRTANDRFALGNPVAKPRRLRTAEEILMAADALSVARQHPVVLVTLACLYGNASARKVMKFKADPEKFDVENALADIMVISRFLPRKLEIEQLGREGKLSFLRSDFLTDDDGLAGILRCFEGDAVSSEQQGDVHQTKTIVTVKIPFLFPELPTSDEADAREIQGMAAAKPSEAEQLSNLLYQ